MANFTVTFLTPGSAQPLVVQVPGRTLLSEAAQQAGLDIGQPCGGQGRCGRCAVQVRQGNVHRRSTLRLAPEDIAQGFALACQTVIEGDVTVYVPAQEAIARRLTSDRQVNGIRVPEGYHFQTSQTVRRYPLELAPPSIDDQTDDWSRLQTALLVEYGIGPVSGSLSLLRRLAPALRGGAAHSGGTAQSAEEWQVSVVIAHPSLEDTSTGRVIDVLPGLREESHRLLGCAIDIGTTTVSLWLVDLLTGEVLAQEAEYNGQIARGEDVISRIVYTSKNGGGAEMQARVVETINKLCERCCEQIGESPSEVIKATIAANTTMMHLLLGIPADSIRLTPFVPVVNQPLGISARDLGMNFCPDAVIDCLPGVASYVGADITAGALASGIAEAEETTLFIDVGTNGEIVLGNRDWLMTCACSAGPAFEGAGVKDGMRATSGAIEEVWINGDTYEPNIRVIGNGKPRGICGSGLISLLAEMFLNGILDKAGRINLTIPSERVRASEQGGEYVIAWAAESASGEDIVLTRVDVDNLLRAKAAIYGGFEVLAEKVGVDLASVDKMLIGGSFGKYINIEKAVQIGLLPDLDWERFKFLGNTSVKGAYFALLDARQRDSIQDIASRMTYVELSADNMFYDAFTSALFLPNTDLSKFPSVQEDLAAAARAKSVVKDQS